MFVPDTNHLYSIVPVAKEDCTLELARQIASLLTEYDGDPFSRCGLSLFSGEIIEQISAEFPTEEHERVIAKRMQNMHTLIKMSEGEKASSLYCLYKDEELVGYSFMLVMGARGSMNILIKKSFRGNSMAGWFCSHLIEKFNLQPNMGYGLDRARRHNAAVAATQPSL